MGIKVELGSSSVVNQTVNTDGENKFDAGCSVQPRCKTETSSYSSDEQPLSAVAAGLFFYLPLSNLFKRLKIVWHMRVANSGVRNFVGNFHIRESSRLMLDIVEGQLNELASGNRASKDGLFVAEYFTKAVGLLQVSEIKDSLLAPEELLGDVVRVLDAGMKIAAWERASGISLHKLDVRLADFARDYLNIIMESFSGSGDTFENVKKGLLIARFVGDYVDDAKYHRLAFDASLYGVDVLLQAGEYQGAREVFNEFVKKDPDALRGSLDYLEWKINFSEYVLGAAGEISAELAKEIYAGMEASVEFESLPKELQEKYFKISRAITSAMLETFSNGFKADSYDWLSVYVPSTGLAAKILQDLERDGVEVTQKVASLMTRFVSVAQLLVAKRYVLSGLGGIRYSMNYSEPRRTHEVILEIPPERDFMRFARFAKPNNALTGMLLRTVAGANMPSVVLRELRESLDLVARKNLRTEKK